MDLRKDYILDRWTIYATERKKRPKEFKRIKEKKQEGICFFCPGNEGLTPPEIGRIKDKNSWKIRWFPNKFPFMTLEKGPVKKSKFFNHMPAYGKHEVIAECNDHSKQLWDLPKSHIKEILYVYRNRIEELKRLNGIKYVLVFKNHGQKGGTSLIHSHTQVVAMNMMPSLIKEEVDAVKKHKGCPYCSIIKTEKKSKRKCFENKSVVAFAPYASRFNYETWIFTKRHITNLTELNDKEMDDLAEILRKVIVKLRSVNFSYNFFLHYAPGLHFHIEITPREAIWAGFELSSDITINSVSPESAASFYRSK